MSTRDVAKTLRETADYLDSIGEFDTEDTLFFSTKNKVLVPSVSFYDKDRFVAAVKAMGNATKHYDEGDYARLHVTATAFPLSVNISRDKVCRKVVKFECEPLFTGEELESL